MVAGAGKLVLRRSAVGRKGIEKRGSLGNFAPATGITKVSSCGDKRWREFSELFGAGGGFARQVFDGWDYAIQGRYGMAAVQSLAPKAIKDAAKGVEMASTKAYDDPKGRMVAEVDMGDAFWKAIGFQPTVVSRIQEHKYMQMQDKNLYDVVRDGISEQWARAIYEKDSAGAKRAQNLIKEWNAKNPNTPVKVKLSNVLRRVEQMRKSAAERFVDAMPKDLRKQREEMLLN